MELLKEIIKLKEDLAYLERQYINSTPVCENINCVWFRINGSMHCSWSVLVEECKEYTTEKPENETQF